jgi:hypothetical protein
MDFDSMNLFEVVFVPLKEFGITVFVLRLIRLFFSAQNIGHVVLFQQSPFEPFYWSQ